MRYLVILLAVLLSAGCQKKSTKSAENKLTAVASNFAIYDFARVIGGDRAEVTLLLPPGVESHSYEPTPQDMIKVKSADLLLCIGLVVEPWVESLVKGAELPADRVVETGRAVQFLTQEQDEHEGESHEPVEKVDEHASCSHSKPAEKVDEHASCSHSKPAEKVDEHASCAHSKPVQSSCAHTEKEKATCEHSEPQSAHANCEHSGPAVPAKTIGPVEGGDPHIWIDPIRAMLMVEEIATKFIEIDSAGAKEYRQRADSLKQEINNLHSRLDSTLHAVPNKTIMYAGHFAFGYFVDRYDLEHISPYSSFSPNSEPTPAKIAELISTIKTKKIKAIYYEELVEPRVAKIITEETGAEMLLLHGIHNVGTTELAGTFSYLSGMEANRVALAKGLAQ